MATKVFPTEMADRGTVLGADKLLIWNSTTGSSEETATVTELLSDCEKVINKSTSISSDGTSDTKYPSTKSVKTYVDTLVGAVADGSPKDVYATLAALQAAFPTGTTGIYVTSDNGHWYFWIGSAWTDGGVYQTALSVVQTTGTSETDIMSQNAVSENLASIITEKIGKNKFNILDADVTLGKYVDSDDGVLRTNALVNATGFIPVTEETAYTLSYKHSIAWYNSSKEFISGSSSADTNKTQTSPSGAAYLRCSAALASWEEFQVEEGSVETAFEAYYTYNELNSSLQVPISSIPTLEDRLDLAVSLTTKVGKNKFNILDADVTLGKYVDNTDGSLRNNASYNSTGFIPVTAETTYTLGTLLQKCISLAAHRLTQIRHRPHP